MTEEEKLKKINASISYWKEVNADRFERAMRNTDIIGIIGLIALIGCGLFLALGMLILILIASS